MKPDASYTVTNSMEPPVSSPPLEYSGKTLTLDIDVMRLEQPYRIVYRGKPAIAIKHLNGHIRLYGLS